MVKASKGYRRRTRSVMQKRARDRGLSPITRMFQKFAVGDKVNVNIDPSMHKGQPHVRFHGKTGTVVRMQGSAYLLDIRMGDMMKQIIVRPEHLRKAQ
ncbi:MAG: 50S ribosomal protein L21e [Euryarchaeota archaeon RBG_13_57_23]|nr:MAG: 50S ribosomal protein L21e [Euryarchaeota archaeon RBG_13_57_23]OGS57062.1 MAG: 50S ribosomal protein L21e [Euryarchaeota archaeon RBG_19FT_COMBO_56_21]